MSILSWNTLGGSSVGARSVMVIIGASQALDPGSIPGERISRLGHWRNRKRACFASTRYGDRNPDAPLFSFVFRPGSGPLISSSEPDRLALSSGSSVGRAWV